MQMFRLFVSAIVTVGAIVVAAPSSHAQTYGIGTNPQGSLFYAIGAAIAKVVAVDTNMQLRVQPYAGTTTFLPLLDRGRLDFAVNNPIETTLAVRGKQMFDGKPNPNLRVVTTLFPTYTGVAVRDKDSAHSLADLKGQKMPAGFTGQQIVQLMTEAYLANVGLSYKDFQPVPVTNVVTSAEEFAAGRVCCTVNLVGTAAVEEVNASIPGGVRFLSIDNTPEAVARMRTITPGAYVATLKPAPRFVGVKDATNFLAWDVLLITSAKVHDDVVYKMTKALFEKKQELIKAHPAFRSFNPQKMVQKDLEVQYHPGAIKFYKEKGLW